MWGRKKVNICREFNLIFYHSHRFQAVCTEFSDVSSSCPTGSVPSARGLKLWSSVSLCSSTWWNTVMKIGETLIVYEGGFLIYFCLQANSDGLDGCSKRFRLLCQGRASYGRGGLGATFRGQRQSRKVIVRQYSEIY